MLDFATIIERVLAHEGGYVNNAADPGGATNYGITERVAREWGFKGDMRTLPRQTAIQIYRLKYWTPIRGEDVHPAVAFQVLDAAINHGNSRAIEWLQLSAGVFADGDFGPVTLAAVKASPPSSLILTFNATRLRFYTDLPTWSTFGKGWSRRLAANLRLAAEDLKC